jgi:2,3-bisphosphoglycerate-dependent phosphoglycerate mutase
MGERTGTVTLLRHGESVANANGLFTGSLDVPLTSDGVQESLHGAELISAAGFAIDVIFTSPLRRARSSAALSASVLGVEAAAIRPDWRLTERSYGALTGQSKSDVLHRYGRESFLYWRRSVAGAPPPMSEVLHRRLAAQEPFRGAPAAALPYTESLHDVILRVDGFLKEAVFRLLRQGVNVLLVAHGNSLRAVCALLDDLRDDEISALNIPTGQPMVYEFDDALQPIARGGRYLDEAAALEAAAEVAAQGGT